MPAKKPRYSVAVHDAVVLLASLLSWPAEGGWRKEPRWASGASGEGAPAGCSYQHCPQSSPEQCVGTLTLLNQVPVAGWWECLLWSSLLGMFNQLFHSDCCTGWQLLESGSGTSAEQESDRDTARLAEAAVQPRLSAVPPGKRPLFPDDAVENGLCLCTSTAELNVLPIVFHLHCLHVLAFIYIQM